MMYEGKLVRNVPVIMYLHSEGFFFQHDSHILVYVMEWMSYPKCHHVKYFTIITALITQQCMICLHKF